MSLFFIAVVLLLVASVGLLYFPWSTRDNVDRDTLNRDFYHARLQEIEQDDPAGRDAMVAELQRTLLTDIPTNAPAATRASGGRILLPGALALVVISVGVFWKTADVGEVANLRLAQEALPTLVTRLLDRTQPPLRTDEVEQLALGLRSHVQTAPDDLDAWRMLGRIGMVMNNGEMAIGAYAKASQLAPDSAVLSLEYAGALICAGDDSARRQGEMKLRELLTKHPDRLRAAALKNDRPPFNLLVQNEMRCDAMVQHMLQGSAP